MASFFFPLISLYLPHIPNFLSPLLTLLHLALFPGSPLAPMKSTSIFIFIGARGEMLNVSSAPLPPQVIKALCYLQKELKIIHRGSYV